MLLSKYCNCLELMKVKGNGAFQTRTRALAAAEIKCQRMLSKQSKEEFSEEEAISVEVSEIPYIVSGEKQIHHCRIHLTITVQHMLTDHH